MPALTIPNSYKGGLEALLGLSDEAATDLRVALEQEPPGLDLEETISDLARLAPGLDAVVNRQIVESLMALYTLRSTTTIPVTELAEAVVESDDLNIPEDRRDRARERLTAFLTLKSLLVTSRAVNVATDHERAFEDARILTDLRPIFGDS